jgi:hypothetical protein
MPITNRSNVYYKSNSKGCGRHPGCLRLGSGEQYRVTVDLQYSRWMDGWDTLLGSSSAFKDFIDSYAYIICVEYGFLYIR